MRPLVTLAVLLVALSNCTNVSRCKNNTLLVELTLQSGTAAADQLVVAVTVDNGTAVITTVSHSSGRANGTIEVDFPSGYPVGQSITVDVSATQGGSLLAEQSLSATLSSGCTTAELTLSPSSGDMFGNGGDMPASGGDLASIGSTMDLSAADLAMPDLSVPSLCSTVTITTLAGNGTAGFVDGTGGATGTTEFNFPTGLAVDSGGILYVADSFNNRIRTVASDGTTTTLAGNGTAGFVDGSGGATGSTEFNSPIGVAVTGKLVIVADSVNNRIRTVALSPGSLGLTTTLAGNGTQGFFDGTGGPGGTTEFYGPVGVAVDTGTFAGNIYVVEFGNDRIRTVASGGATTTLAGNGTAGFFDGTGGATGTTMFSNPHGLAFDGTNNVVSVADSYNNRIREVMSSNGATTTLAGNGTGGFVDGTGGPSGSTEFTTPFALAVDSVGNIYVVDGDNNAIRRVAPDGTTTTLARNGGTGANACAAGLYQPRGVALFGKLMLISDSSNNRIRQIQLP